MKREVAIKLANETRDSYDQVAREFSDSRARFWEELEFLAEHATAGMRVLDIGCGNGRFYPLLKARDVDYTGLDNSAGLLKEALRLHAETSGKANFVLGDATALPFPDRSFDIAFSFATIHHIPSLALREKFVQEAARVLVPGGKLVLTAWDLWQPPHGGKYLFALFANLNPFSDLDVGDMILTFGKQKHKRYLHAFTKRSLVQLLRKNGFTIIDADIVERKSGSGQKNILVIAQKIV